MNKHFQNLATFINSIYVAWPMVLSSIFDIIHTVNADVYDWKFYFHIFVILK